MGRIGIEESATVSSKFFDRFLASDRTTREILKTTSKRMKNFDRAKILNHPIEHQNECCNKAKWKQDFENRAVHVHPEIAK